MGGRGGGEGIVWKGQCRKEFQGWGRSSIGKGQGVWVSGHLGEGNYYDHIYYCVWAHSKVCL